MKKIALLAALITLAHLSFSQAKIGLRFAPTISFNSIDGEGIYEDVENNGSSIRFSAGLVTDFFFADNYAFSTGAWYTIKRFSIGGSIPDGANGVRPANSNYNLQYLQIPAALKLYTNEISPDLRVFFILGGTFDLKLAEKEKDEDNNWLYQLSEIEDKNAFRPVDAGILLGAGVELQLGSNTGIFGGLNYNRSLANALSNIEYTGERISDDLKVKNSYLSLEIGLKF